MPPNWQGVIFVCRSADSVWVTREKMQSAGDDGGVAYLDHPFGISSFGNSVRSASRSVTTRAVLGAQLLNRFLAHLGCAG